MPYTYRGRTVDEWRRAGQEKLSVQRVRALGYSELYDGEPVGTMLVGEQRDVFKRLNREARTNWCELIINAVAERLYVMGFHFGDPAIDDLAWAIWQASSMDADSEMTQTDALVCAHSFVAVWPDEANPTGVTIYPEHPAEVTCFYEPGRRRVPVAAFKSFGGTFTANRVDVLVLPDRVETWTPGGVTTEDNAVGVVPYREVTPAPRTLGPPRSELHSAAAIQRRINTTVYNRMVATDFDAFRQVTATGVTVKETAPGVYEPPFNVGSDRLLWAKNVDAKFGSIPGSGLNGFLDAVQADVMHMAAITQTPPHYLLGQIVNASGDALKAAETGLVAKVRRRAAHIGEAWEDVMRLALGMIGEASTVDYQAEVIWRDFESRSEGELVAALATMASLGVPLEKVWARWGASPQEIKAWSAQQTPEPATTATAATATTGTE